MSTPTTTTPKRNHSETCPSCELKELKQYVLNIEAQVYHLKKELKDVKDMTLSICLQLSEMSIKFMESRQYEFSEHKKQENLLVDLHNKHK